MRPGVALSRFNGARPGGRTGARLWLPLFAALALVLRLALGDSPAPDLRNAAEADLLASLSVLCHPVVPAEPRHRLPPPADGLCCVLAEAAGLATLLVPDAVLLPRPTVSGQVRHAPRPPSHGPPTRPVPPFLPRGPPPTVS